MQYLTFYSQFIDIENPQADGYTSCRCPIHNDKNNSAGVDLRTGVFNCFKCGVFRPSKFLQQVDKTVGPELASLIVNDYRLKNNVITHDDKHVTYTTPWRSPKFEELAELCKQYDFTEVPFVQEYAEEHGLHMQTLMDAGLGFLPAEHTFWNRDSLVFVYWLGGRVVGLRYRDDQGNKIYEPGSHGTLWRTEVLDVDDSVCVITEGESDALRCQQETGLKTLASPGVTFRKEWERELIGLSRIILIPQADEASVRLVEGASRTLRDRLKVFTLPWERGQIGKDLCHWLIHNQPEQLKHQLTGLASERLHAKVMGYNEFQSYAHNEGKSTPVIEKLFGCGEIAILGGHPKSMKTWLAINMIRTIMSPTETFCSLPHMYGCKEPQRILFIEEEGNAEKLMERCELVFKGIDLDGKLFFGHRLGLQMDTEEGLQKILNAIEKHHITGMFMDPFQRLMSGDENSATETAPFWNNLHRIHAMFPKSWSIVLHHFSGSANFIQTWQALRGSTRGAGEVDLGIFIEKRPQSEGLGIKAKFDGRNIEPMETPDGKDVFPFYFKKEDGRFYFDATQVMIDKHLALLNELRTRREWSVSDAAAHFGCNMKTISRWVDKLGDKAEQTAPAPGSVAMIRLTPKGLLG